jgi:hypothetical protein
MPVRLSLIASFAVVLSGCSPDTGNAPAEPSAGAPPTAPAAPAAPSLARKPSPAGARVYIISPRDGETVSSPVRVVFGLSGAGVAPAGIVKENTGHHHLLIDTAAPTLDLPIPADATHVHFGGGQTETTVTLTPGRHTLQLLLADELHVPHDPPLISDVVTIDVQ